MSQEKFKMSEDHDPILNLACYKAGMPYECYGCAGTFMPKDLSHKCFDELGTDKESEYILANPYGSTKVHLVHKITLLNESIDPVVMVMSLAEKYPLIAAVMSKLSGACEAKREEWLKDTDLDPEVKQRLIASVG